MAKKSSKSEKLEDRILQNMIELQKVHVNLAEKFESLSHQISSLLALFEMTARSFAKQTSVQLPVTSEKDKEFLEKIDKLLEQNKTIAKGLTLMEQRVREKLYGPIVPSSENRPQERPKF